VLEDEDDPRSSHGIAERYRVPVVPWLDRTALAS
jgi:hypothetical protein